MDTTIHVGNNDTFTVEVAKHKLTVGSVFYIVTITVDRNTFKLFFNEDQFHFIENHFANYNFTDYTEED